jgi:hypothetical protein
MALQIGQYVRQSQLRLARHRLRTDHAVHPRHVPLHPREHASPRAGGAAGRLRQHVALTTGVTEAAAKRTEVRIAGRIDRLLCITSQAADQHVYFFLVRRRDAAHHVLHQRPTVSVSAHAYHHAVDDLRPLVGVMHGRIRNVVALNTVACQQRGAARSGFRQRGGIERGRQDARQPAGLRRSFPAGTCCVDRCLVRQRTDAGCNGAVREQCDQ